MFGPRRPAEQRTTGCRTFLRSKCLQGWALHSATVRAGFSPGSRWRALPIKWFPRGKPPYGGRPLSEGVRRLTVRLMTINLHHASPALDFRGLHMVSEGSRVSCAAGFAVLTGLMLLMVAVLVLAACTTTPTPHVVSDYERSAQFSTFHNFTLIARPQASIQGALVEQRTYDAIRAELTSKGFTYVPDPAQADFVVDFSVGSQDRLDAKSYPTNFASPWNPGAWGNEADVRWYQQGTLAIVAFDVRSRRAVWRGMAEKQLSRSDIEHSERPIREAVTAVLANFPPK